MEAVEMARRNDDGMCQTFWSLMACRERSLVDNELVICCCIEEKLETGVATVSNRVHTGIRMTIDDGPSTKCSIDAHTEWNVFFPVSQSQSAVSASAGEK